MYLYYIPQSFITMFQAAQRIVWTDGQADRVKPIYPHTSFEG